MVEGGDSEARAAAALDVTAPVVEDVRVARVYWMGKTQKELKRARWGRLSWGGQEEGSPDGGPVVVERSLALAAETQCLEEQLAERQARPKRRLKRVMRHGRLRRLPRRPFASGSSRRGRR